MLSKLDWSQILLFGKGLNRQVQRCIFKAKFWPDQKKNDKESRNVFTHLHCIFYTYEKTSSTKIS